MKHLISLSMKYIRRRKLRTLLTYLCVVLSVFILCTFGAFSNSLFTSVLNMEKQDFGSWEADFSSVIEESSNKRKTAKAITEHAVVDDHLVSLSTSEYLRYARDENGGKVVLFEFSDGKTSKRLNYICHKSYSGNPELTDKEERNYFIQYEGTDGMIVPGWVRELGYSEGDILTFSLDVIMADYDEESPDIKSIRKEVLDSTGLPYVKDDPEYEELSADDKKKAEKANMAGKLMSEGMTIDEFPLTNIIRGVKKQFRVRIAGFTSTSQSDSLYLYENKLGSDIFGEFLSDNYFYPEQEVTAQVRINDSIDFDDAIEMMLTDLGYDVFYEGIMKNTEILALELRSADAITMLVPLAGVAFCIIFLIWALARFIIDNAFEISAAERSSQFAALRVMGASKGQLLAIVLTEAFFYSLTAVPMGCGGALLFCASSMKSFRDLGMDYFVFSVHPLMMMLMLFLSLLAIFVSSYTSSIYGARKLSPAEAMHFGKPKSKRRLKKEQKAKSGKSKLRLRSGGFIRRYTIKNIKRTKSRFIISTITMTIGVVLFTFTIILGITAYVELDSTNDREADEMTKYDYMMNYYGGELGVTAYDTFIGSENFADVKVSGGGFTMTVNSKKTDMDAYNAFLAELPYQSTNVSSSKLGFSFIDRGTYERIFGGITDMTYDELAKSNTGILCLCDIGPGTKYNKKTKKYDGLYDKMYRKLDEPVEVQFSSYMVAKGLKIGAVAVSDYRSRDVIFPLDSDFMYEMNYNDVYVDLRFKDDKHREAAMAEIREFEEKYQPAFVTDTYMLCTGRKLFISSLVKIAGAIILSIWLVGVLSMVNSVNTSILNRSRELMMLRSVGMSRKQLKNTVILESLLFSSLSSVLGNLIAFLLAAAMLSLYSTSIIASLIAIAISITINVIVSVLGSIPGIRSLSKVEAIAKTE